MTTAPARTTGRAAAQPITSEAIMDAFRELVFAIPEAPEDDGSSIVLAILQADDWTEANGEGSLPSSKTLVGEPVTVDRVARKVSDKPSATGYYLMCDGAMKATGKPVRFTAGGAQAVAMLAKAHVAGWLPATVEFTLETTRSGNEAVNCKIHEIHVGA